MTISSPDLAFRNLSEVWSAGISLQTFEDESRAVAFELTNKLLGAVTGKDLEGLETTLKYIYWDLRGHIPNPERPEAGWFARRVSLQNELGINVQVLSTEELGAGKELILRLNALAEKDSVYSEQILNLLEREPETVFVVEKPRQLAEVDALLIASTEEPLYQVFNLGRFVSFPPTEFKQVVVLAAPRKISDNFMRAITLGGIAGKFCFLAPNWLIGNEPSTIRQELAPTLKVAPLPKVNVVGPQFDRPVTEVPLETVELKDYTNPADIERLMTVGDIDCRYVHLNDGLVIPIEDDAARISILERQDDGLLRVEFRDPFDGLAVGDVVFNLRDGAEDDFLMDLAVMAMGQEFRSFASGRLLWKSRAHNLIEAQGYDQAVSKLKAAGVSTAHYLKDWLDDDDFVSPRAKSDWANLLKALEFSIAEVKSLTKLSSKLRSHLISIGQSARSAMADSIDASDWDLIREGKVVSKKLAEYGDAEFLLSTVTDIGDVAVKCHPNDLRKVRRL